VLDLIESCVNLAVLICEALTIFLVNALVVPIVGIVLAIVGGIVALLSLFFTSKQASPAQNYMQNVVVPFVNSLPAAPAGWTPPTVPA
jgi:hypothetical protein